MTEQVTVLPHRADALELHLGDPRDPANPLGFPHILAADERAEMFADGERALDAYGLGAEFAPARYGGRLTRLDELVEIMRSVYRRDPCLGLGHGVSSFIASVNIWTAGSEEQCRQVADLLLSGRKVAVAYHELAHGNDMVGTEFEAFPEPGGWFLLNGRKEVVTNIRRADAVVMFARTDRRAGSRSHSLAAAFRPARGPLLHPRGRPRDLPEAAARQPAGGLRPRRSRSLPDVPAAPASPPGATLLAGRRGTPGRPLPARRGTAVRPLRPAEGERRRHAGGRSRSGRSCCVRGAGCRGR
jgi:hypothetical protein